MSGHDSWKENPRRGTEERAMHLAKLVVQKMVAGYSMRIESPYWTLKWDLPLQRKDHAKEQAEEVYDRLWAAGLVDVEVPS